MAGLELDVSFRGSFFDQQGIEHSMVLLQVELVVRLRLGFVIWFFFCDSNYKS